MLDGEYPIWRVRTEGPDSNNPKSNENEVWFLEPIS